MPDRPAEARRPRRAWRSGRLTRSRGRASDITDQQYGVEKPDVVGDWASERGLSFLFDDPDDGDCPCGSGQSYRACHGKPAEA